MNPKPYLKLLRVKNWRGFFLMTTIGFIASKGYLSPLKDIVFFYITIVLLFGFGFSINDCFDVKEDRLDKSRKNPIVAGETNMKKGLFFSFFLASLGLALSTLFGLKAFFFYLGAVLVVCLYSVPPLRMKSRPWLDLITHGLFGGCLLFLIPFFAFNKELVLFDYLIAFSLFCFSIILEIRNHLEDYEFDKGAGLRTTVCVLGFERSERLLKFLVVFYPLTLLPVFLLDNWQFFLPFSILTTFFLYFFLFKDNHKIVKNYRIIDIYAAFSLGLALLKKLLLG